VRGAFAGEGGAVGRRVGGAALVGVFAAPPGYVEGGRGWVVVDHVVAVFGVGVCVVGLSTPWGW
jgi:hypothetical protein